MNRQAQSNQQRSQWLTVAFSPQATLWQGEDPDTPHAVAPPPPRDAAQASGASPSPPREAEPTSVASPSVSVLPPLAGDHGCKITTASDGLHDAAMNAREYEHMRAIRVALSVSTSRISSTPAPASCRSQNPSSSRGDGEGSTEASGDRQGAGRDHNAIVTRRVRLEAEEGIHEEGALAAVTWPSAPTLTY